MTDRARDLAELKAALAGRAEDLARALIPDGGRSGHYWMGPRGNFWVNLDGARSPGTWKDPTSDESGGPLDLVMRETGCTFPEALRWARDFLGWEQVSPEERRRTEERMARVRAEADARREADLGKHRRQAFAHWLKASPTLAATPVETYLRTRGIELAALAKPPRALRFAARRHAESDRWWPAMLALITGPDETAWGLHCTFLAEDGSGKAPVEPQRKMWPSFTGGAIRLARGETGLAPAEAAKHGLLDTLCLCEGVEDGLSIALACPELRVWAAGSLGNLRHITLPACTAEVIVAADNDWGKPQAARQLETALAALSAQGRAVSVARSPIGKDANDALVGGGLRMPTGASGRAQEGAA